MVETILTATIIRAGFKKSTGFGATGKGASSGVNFEITHFLFVGEVIAEARTVQGIVRGKIATAGNFGVGVGPVSDATVDWFGGGTKGGTDLAEYGARHFEEGGGHEEW